MYVPQVLISISTILILYTQFSDIEEGQLIRSTLNFKLHQQLIIIAGLKVVLYNYNLFEDDKEIMILLED